MAKKTSTSSGTKKWKVETDINVDFNQLLSSLNNSKIQQSNNALWQTLYQIITRAQLQKDRLVIKFKEVADQIFQIGDTLINNIQNLKDATFWTRDDQTLNFPSSIRVIAGTGITLDYTILNQVTISSSAGANGYWAPLTDGNVDETDLIFAAGECVMVFVPVP